MISGTYWQGRFEIPAIFGSSDPWQLAGSAIARTRVPRPLPVPSHSSAALEARAHVLIERAASFAPPGAVIHDHRPHAGLLPQVFGAQPF